MIKKSTNSTTSSGHPRIEDHQMTMTEWMVLDALCREIKYSIGEFVGFLDRTFDNLDDAWNFLDDDQSGSLSFKEWTDAATSIGYFGPTRPIFSFLDKDDEGTISFTEFQLLREFHVEPEVVEEEEGGED
jgi:Ca2+-binding EF-hand superfamily protein